MRMLAWVGALAVLASSCRHADKRDPNEGKAEEA
jgi:hypothetical protein